MKRMRTERDKRKAQLPAGVDLTVVGDRTHTVKASNADVQFTLILSVVLVVLVVGPAVGGAEGGEAAVGVRLHQIGRAHSVLQSHHDLVCRLLLEKKN